MPNHFWDSVSLSKRLYAKWMTPLSKQYQLTRMELDILLFLANNPGCDTAADIIHTRQLTKSHVSSSIDRLVSLGYLKRTYQPGNSKLIHLAILPAAAPLVEAGRDAQQQFYQALFRGFTPEERKSLEYLSKKIGENLRDALGDAQ